MTYAGAPQYFSIAWTTSSRVAVLLFKPKTAKSEILCQLSERGPMLMLFTRQSASSSSCRLVQHLVQKKQVFNSIDAYISGSIDEGLFHITGKPAPGVTLEAAETAVWQELKALTEESVDEDELEKVKNRYESEQIFNNLNYLNVATNLAYFELTGKAEDINNEVNKYRSVTAGQIKEAAQKTFVRENCSTLYYKSNLPT